MLTRKRRGTSYITRCALANLHSYVGEFDSRASNGSMHAYHYMVGVRFALAGNEARAKIATRAM